MDGYLGYFHFLLFQTESEISCLQSERSCLSLHTRVTVFVGQILRSRLMGQSVKRIF